MERYARQWVFPGIGREGQEKILAARVVVLGCGALGCSSSMALARAGVGHLTLVDRDFPELNNLNRQILFDEADVAARIPKAVAAARRLAQINSSIRLDPVVADVNPANILSILSGADVVVDGTDNLDTRYLLNDAAAKLRIPWVYGGAIAAGGMWMTFRPGRGPCFRCLFPYRPGAGVGETCETAGVLGGLPMAVGGMQAVEVMRLLVGEETVGGRLVSLDGWKGTVAQVDVGRLRARDCPTCRGEYEFLEGKHGNRAELLLCGNTVQILQARAQPVQLDELAARLAPLGEVENNGFLVRFVPEDGIEMVVFADGRTLVCGTSDLAKARSLHAQYVGA
ncbi:MAG: thiazole biosynthesis adenylyltransferase ThiF [Deltaproteobacteria bacterium]|nr:thiazole biosynthesis adenylyltransferase ThiF [Deltaproteobacteria bacterium]